jgi:hypothetical protein
MTHTNQYNAAMMESHYLAKVSHHHYWFKSYADLLAFMDSDWYDSRMTIAFPVK